jgi:NAD(P)-dependent dehydrogenase (short-subunit alcohol dehydrogenase family)
MHRHRLKLPDTVTDTDVFKGVTTMGRLADKNILITGGNSGIGLAAAQEFDREGARVAICGLNEGSLQAAKETLGAGSLAVRADVSNLTDLDTMFATIKREFGHLDGVFANAGYSEFLLFEEVTWGLLYDADDERALGQARSR